MKRSLIQEDKIICTLDLSLKKSTSVINTIMEECTVKWAESSMNSSSDYATFSGTTQLSKKKLLDVLSVNSSMFKLEHDQYTGDFTFKIPMKDVSAVAQTILTKIILAEPEKFIPDDFTYPVHPMEIKQEPVVKKSHLQELLDSPDDEEGEEFQNSYQSSSDKLVKRIKKPIKNGTDSLQTTTTTTTTKSNNPNAIKLNASNSLVQDNEEEDPMVTIGDVLKQPNQNNGLNEIQSTESFLAQNSTNVTDSENVATSDLSQNSSQTKDGATETSSSEQPFNSKSKSSRSNSSRSGAKRL